MARTTSDQKRSLSTSDSSVRLRLVMSLIDQLNTARGDMRALIEALAREPAEVRGRITAHVQGVRAIRRG